MQSSPSLIGLLLVGDMSSVGGSLQRHSLQNAKFWRPRESWAVEVLERQDLSKCYSKLILLHLSELTTPHLVEYCLSKCAEDKFGMASS